MRADLILLLGVVTLASGWLTLRFARSAWTVRDEPTERSLHVHPTPRVGGLAVMASFGAALGLVLALGPLALTDLLPVMVPASLVFACSALEDLVGVPAAVRFVIHLCAAALLVIWTGSSGVSLLGESVPGPAVALVVIVGVVWMANLYNFMDGIDGLAGGMAVVGFAFLAVLAFAADVPRVAIPAALLAAGAGGFLAQNLPPARVFLGDAGSVPLGFLAAALSLVLARDAGMPLVQPALIFTPFWVDATVTLIRRMSRGSGFWRPHREHWYQRLVLAGWSHGRSLRVYYALMCLSGMTALTFGSLAVPARFAAVAALLVAHLSIPALVARAEKRALRPVEV